MCPTSGYVGESNSTNSPAMATQGVRTASGACVDRLSAVTTTARICPVVVTLYRYRRCHKASVSSGSGLNEDTLMGNLRSKRVEPSLWKLVLPKQGPCRFSAVELERMYTASCVLNRHPAVTGPAMDK